MSVRHATVFGALLTLAACATDGYVPPTTISTDALFRTDAPLAADRSIADLPWQVLFSDQLLRELIAHGLERNLDLKVALARIEVAEANLSQSRLAFAPTVQLDAQYGIRRQPAGVLLQAQGTRVAQLTASSTWELDVWGKLRSAKRSSEAELASSWATRRAVQTQLIADIAVAYYTLLAYDRQLAMTEEALRIRVEDVETVKALKDAAILTGADVAQSEANRYAAEVAIPDIKRDIRELEHSLCVLVAEPPHAITRTTLEQQTPVDQLAVGVPAQLLANRPDVQAAELAFRSAFELTNVARTYFYPALTLSAQVGTVSADPTGWFGAGTFLGNIFGGLMQPLLNRGLNRQRLAVAKAQQREALYEFQRSVLQAGREVSDALFAYQTALEKTESRKHQIESLSVAVDATKALLRYTSNTNYVDVLTAEQGLLNAQVNSTNDRLQQLTAVVALYRALGGGWKEL